MNETSDAPFIRTATAEYWKEQIKCQAACPVHTDARGYVRAIAEGNDERAYLIARGPNPLASICGRVCGAPCETACRRGSYDRPVAIRALKRFACERYGPEAGRLSAEGFVDLLKDAARHRSGAECVGKEELLPLLRSLMRGDIPAATGKSVGIVGGGPAGLAAAHDLALLGCEVTIYEMEPLLAGMLVVGVPQYRLSREVIQAEVAVITALGVKAVTNCRVGADISFPELRSRHDAVIIAVGAKNSRRLPVPGIDAQGVIGGVEFLRDVAVGRPPKLGRRVVVIGGGNVAFDVGRTVLRQIGIDAARTALRQPVVAQVHLCSLESLEEMPADDVEIIEGDEEGIVRCHGMGPQAILQDAAGRVTGVRFQKCLRVFDEAGRFNPVFDAGQTLDISCDNVLLAVGQSYDLGFIDAGRDGLSLRPNGGVECNPVTGETSAPDVFMAGDLAHGPKLLIHAVASGKAVARAVYRHLTGRTIRFEDTTLHFPMPAFDREPDYEKIQRIKQAAIPVEERLKGHDRIVEQNYDEAAARREASRCLNCNVNTIFDGSRCLLCGGCVDVCPVSCLRIVPADGLGGEAARIVAAKREEDSTLDVSAILKDETRCIRCGLCADRCPSGAITMESFHLEERCICQDV
ncbi:MAG TPA: FAD-dependent oxidoreductase [Candidatus Hydrogenedentes bacterium]|nr:FAD-dependent oxidoreductase [Candidatus Hydrogenedentota bacterium]HOV73248.1 FAD-dependent oxidoreductase [Candidatus Hydrogenedentota bacterium]